MFWHLRVLSFIYIHIIENSSTNLTLILFSSIVFRYQTYIIKYTAYRINSIFALSKSENIVLIPISVLWTKIFHQNLTGILSIWSFCCWCCNASLVGRVVFYTSKSKSKVAKIHSLNNKQVDDDNQVDKHQTAFCILYFQGMN